MLSTHPSLGRPHVCIMLHNAPNNRIGIILFLQQYKGRRCLLCVITAVLDHHRQQHLHEDRGLYLCVWRIVTITSDRSTCNLYHITIPLITLLWYYFPALLFPMALFSVGLSSPTNFWHSIQLPFFFLLIPMPKWSLFNVIEIGASSSERAKRAKPKKTTTTTKGE